MIFTGNWQGRSKNNKGRLSSFLCLMLLGSLLLIGGCGSDDGPLQPREGQSVARMWNEVLLNAIRNDYARPTVHARNLFHISAAMYDAWSHFDGEAQAYLWQVEPSIESCENAQLMSVKGNRLVKEEAISQAAYNLIVHRFAFSPFRDDIVAVADNLMSQLGFALDADEGGQGAKLGQAIAQCYIDYGYADGSNERLGYQNRFYSPVNPSLEPAEPGNPNIVDYNRWQALLLDSFIDQAGNSVEDAPEFLSPEWGAVKTFALTDADRDQFERNGNTYSVYHDPGMPPQLGMDQSQAYQWNFALVAVWSSHLDQSDEVMMDISPKSVGNLMIEGLPTNLEEYKQFYLLEGGDTSQGYEFNPITGEAYEPQIVPRGDYSRVLAEFWADGPDSETPPGHWFVILNEVTDHPDFETRFMGVGEPVPLLEWDIKAYFTLGGAMHDAAVAAWGIKGWYDYIRPVSAIRAMADLGQSSDPTLPNYHVNGIPLVEGVIELVTEADVFAQNNIQNLNKIKIKAWRGPDQINNPVIDQAGVGWILADHWWPYQRPTFVTPPFAGYVSGHSTYSRAAAEVMTAITGSQYFPGGMSDFKIKKNQFLVFEEGPSVDLTLQWASYYDASDQCSLSRIWGGIHPPVDDIPGRRIGQRVGLDAFEKAQGYFTQ